MSEVVISNPQLIKLSTFLYIPSSMCLSKQICIYSFILPFSRFLLMCTFGTRHHHMLKYAAILLSSS